MKRLDAQPDDDPATAIRESVGPGMPFRYRTPDQVAYARGEADLSCQSDVFQLALVLTELFTGRNPERRAAYDAILSPVQLDPIGFVPGALGLPIRNLLETMLESDPANRPTAAELLDPWQGLLEQAAERMRALEGRVY